MPTTLAGWAVLIIIFLAICAVVGIAARAMGYPVPPWLAHIALVIVIAVVAILAIQFLAGVVRV